MFTDAQALVEVEAYMEKQNWPYSAQNILDNLQGKLKIAQAKKICDQLAEKKVLTVKEYGKAKIFLINQDRFADMLDGKDQD